MSSYKVGDTTYQFPDTMSDDDVQKVLTQQGIIKAQQPAQTPNPTIWDTLRNATSAVAAYPQALSAITGQALQGVTSWTPAPTFTQQNGGTQMGVDLPTVDLQSRLGTPAAIAGGVEDIGKPAWQALKNMSHSDLMQLVMHPQRAIGRAVWEAMTGHGRVSGLPGGGEVEAPAYDYGKTIDTSAITPPPGVTPLQLQRLGEPPPLGQPTVNPQTSPYTPAGYGPELTSSMAADARAKATAIAQMLRKTKQIDKFEAMSPVEQNAFIKENFKAGSQWTTAKSGWTNVTSKPELHQPRVQEILSIARGQQ